MDKACLVTIHNFVKIGVVVGDKSNKVCFGDFKKYVGWVGGGGRFVNVCTAGFGTGIGIGGECGGSNGCWAGKNESRAYGGKGES